MIPLGWNGAINLILFIGYLTGNYVSIDSECSLKLDNKSRAPGGFP